MKNSQSSLLIVSWIFMITAISLVIIGFILGGYNLLIFFLGEFVGFIIMMFVKVGDIDE